MLHRLRLLGIPLAFTVLAAAPAFGKPLWISIELPANPFDSATSAAFLVVHAFHFSSPVSLPIEGMAEGIVNGERRSIRLEFTRTRQEGAYALRKQWPSEGTWTLVIHVVQEGSDGATALVELGSEGEVTSVKVPTHRQDRWNVPSRVSPADVDGALRARAALLARKS